jgi:hypothetical protein
MPRNMGSRQFSVSVEVAADTDVPAARAVVWSVVAAEVFPVDLSFYIRVFRSRPMRSKLTSKRRREITQRFVKSVAIHQRRSGLRASLATSC